MNAKRLVSEKRGLSPVFILLLGMLVLVLTHVNEAQATPPAWQASSAIAASTGANVTVTLPTHLANDILLLQVVVRDVNDTITWPAGWTQIATVDRGATARYWWAWKRAASAAETNPLVSKSTATGDTYAAVTTYRGANTTGDPWEVKGTPNTATTAGHALNGITTLSFDTLIVASLCGEDNTAATGTTFAATDPVSLTEVLYVESATGADGACTTGAGSKATIGATGNVTATWTATVVGSGGIVFALKPPPPTVSSINRASPNPTSVGATVSWTVVFSTGVTGVDASDFALVQAGGATGASITSVTGSGTTWTVTANTGTGAVGTLGLNLVDNDSINNSGMPLGGAGVGNGNFTGQVYTLALMATSINRASTDPTTANTAVSWTVVFSTGVTGVDAADFTLVQAGGVTGASITSVTGSGTTWTVTANTGTGAVGTLGLNLVDNDTIVDGSGNRLGGTGAGNGNFTGQVYTVCSPPSNIPVGVTVSCVCDAFGRASLNPSTIFGGDWVVSRGASDTSVAPPPVVPYIAGTGYLRLTENAANNAKAATVPGIFPAAGNYISVEFNHYAYSGTATGADGVAVTLSDYSVPAVPGGFGGSLGYAQRNDGALPPGFAGGWVGVALDEYGNYQSSTEGRVLGACGTAACLPQSIGVRGPGNGANGYRWMGGTASNPGGLSIDNRASATPAPGYMFQVIVDARNSGTGTINVSVNRDATTKDGSNYVSLFGPFNAYTEANFALTSGWIAKIVPDYWQISFTGSTGGSNNIHEIGGLRICAQTVIPPTGGTASGFSAIDEAYPGAPTVPAYPNFQTGHIYMKLTGVSFQLWVAALTSTGISTGYSATSNKYVAVKLVDNSDNACGPDSARTCNSTCTNKTAVETGATQIAAFASGGTTGVASPSPTFTLNSAWKNLIAVMKECTTSACTAFTATAPACSADSFSVRPTGISSVTSSNATNTGTSGTPVFKAGTDSFSLTATIPGIGSNPGGYTGTPKINSASIQAVSPAVTAGAVTGSFSAATSSTGSSTATGASFTYSEVGTFRLRAPDFTVPRIPGVYDDSWTAVDSDPLKNDCISGTTATAYTNTKTSGKYGCNFGITADSGGFGRFIPDHFDVAYIDGCSGVATFTYSGQPFTVTATARNSAGGTTLNYDGTYGFSKDTTISNAGVATNFTPNNNTSSNNLLPAGNFVNGVRSQSTVTYTFPVKETVPTTIALRAIDTDSVSSAGHTEETAEIRSGRLRLINAYGSELVALSLPMRVEYYEDTTITAPATNPPTTGWITNTADTCTSLSLPNLDLQNAVHNPAQGVATINIKTGPNIPSTVTVVTPTAGAGELSFSAPGAGGDGYADARLDLSARSWLQFDWNGAGNTDPTARATFGLFRGSPTHIYLRQRYN